MTLYNDYRWVRVKQAMVVTAFLMWVALNVLVGWSLTSLILDGCLG